MSPRWLAAAFGVIAVTAQVAAETDPTTLAQSIAGAKRIRVTVANGSFVVTRPRVEDDGLHFRNVEGYPPRRRALLVSADLPPPPEPPKSPLTWSQIRRVERRHTTYGPGTPVGGVLGLLGGAVVGLPVAYAVRSAAENGWAAYGVIAACDIGGTVIGAKAMGETEEWIQVYPVRTEAR